MNSFLIYSIFIVLASYPFYLFLISLLELLKIKAMKSILFRNDLLSFAYLIKDLGPGVSAFSVIEFITASTKEDKTTLFIVFIVGILIMLLGRKIRDLIAQGTQETRKSVDLSNIKKLINN